MTEPSLTFGGGPAGPEAWRLVARGFRCRCPRCGEGRLFGRFLKVAPACEQCGLAFHHHRADDFPPYIVMFVVGHLVGYGIYTAETRFDEVPLWFHAALWPTLTVGLCLALLQPVKGAVVALQYALGMHGFVRGTNDDGDRRRTEESAVERGAHTTPDGPRHERAA